MLKERLPKIARDSLDGLCDEVGSILYSSHETLKLGSIYLMGFNPGGTDGSPLEDSIEDIHTNENNSYLDECWKNGKAEKGKAPLQHRIQWILSELGLNTREVCASNLIFVKSRNAEGIDFELAKKCWPVHGAILNIVRPKLILTFGNSSVSPYGYIRKRFPCLNEMSIPSGHGDWQVKGFDTVIDGRKTYVAGLPHLSRYSPIYKLEDTSDDKYNIIQWLKTKL